MSDNLPEDWEPYVVEPSAGWLFWVSVVLALLVLIGVVLYKSQDYKLLRGCVPMLDGNRPVQVCEP